MLIFYCILLVLTFLFILMEIFARPEINILGTQIDTERHKYHLIVYTIIFLSLCFLIFVERYANILR